VINKIINILKKIIISAFVLYGYNVMASPLNIIIPINIVTVGLLTILGIPAIFSLIVIYIVIF